MVIALAIIAAMGWVCVIILMFCLGFALSDLKTFQLQCREFRDRFEKTIGIHQLEISGSSIESLIQAAKQAKKRGIAPIESYFVDLGRKGKFMVLLDDSGKVFDSDGNPFRFDHILEVKAFGGN